MKKIWKRICSFVTAAGLLLPSVGMDSLQQLTVYAESSDYTGAYVYKEHLYYDIADGEVAITDYDNSYSAIAIPPEINGMPVTKIDVHAFRMQQTYPILKFRTA